MYLPVCLDSRSIDIFLEFWSERYYDPKNLDRDKYDCFVGKPLTCQSLRSLFEWKNGSPLSAKKYESVKKNYPLLSDKGGLRARYLDPKDNGGPIWNIFYMHCTDPMVWPIFDRRSYQAMRFMKSGKIEKLPSEKKRVYHLYEYEYIPFAKSLGQDERKIDKALYTFGQFLSRTGSGSALVRQDDSNEQ